MRFLASSCVLTVWGFMVTALPGCGSSTSQGAGGTGSDAATPEAGSSTDAAAIDGPVSGASDASPFADAGPALDGATRPDAGAGKSGDGGAAPVMSLGYYTGDDGSYAAIMSFHSYLTMVSADLYDVQTDGSIVGSDANPTPATDTSFGISTFACLSNYNDSINDFDPSLGHSAMVTNETKVIANALTVVEGGYRGLNVDFESIAYSTNTADDRAAYTKFIGDLSTALHAKGFLLVISVPAKTSDDPTDTWTYPYDFTSLGPLVDVLQLMTYDENGPEWSAPGPVSGADWALQSDQYAASLVSPAKIVAGLPAYGYDWDLTASNPSANTYAGTSVPWTGFAALLATSGAAMHWDAATSSPYVDYTSSDGHMHEAWYENAQSIQVKTAYVKMLGLGGISMWALGDEDAAFWQAAYAGLQ